MTTGLVGFLLGFGAAWGLAELAYRRWKRRVLARTNEALDAAEARIELRKAGPPVELRPPVAYTEAHIELMLRLWRGLPDSEVPPAGIDDLVALGFAEWDWTVTGRHVPKITGAGIDQLIRRGLRK